MAVVALAAIQDLLAEKASWGGPEWTASTTTTAAANVAVIAAATNANTVKVQHYLDYLTISFSAVPTASSAVVVKDGTTVIWTSRVGIGAVSPVHFDFSHRPLRNTAGALLSAECSATLGDGIIIDVQMIGHSNVPSTPA